MTEMFPTPSSSSGQVALNNEYAQQGLMTELLANRPNQTNTFGSVEWTHEYVDSTTGRPVTTFGNEGRYVDKEWADAYNIGTPEEKRALMAGGVPYVRKTHVNPTWEMNSQLNPEWQSFLDDQRGLAEQQTAFRGDMLGDWENSGTQFDGYGQVPTTIGRSDLNQFGYTNPNLGAQDWRQFGTTGQTINAGDWQNLGYSDATIGADDWREFGTTNPLLTGGTYDERYGGANADPTGGYGSHSQDGSDWDLINYAPEAIRSQAEQQTLDFMYSQLDPQWDTRLEALEVQLANQGLQWGDAAYDNAMSSFKNSRDQAYAGARNQALADSRAEAMMLWDQEMARSEQKNYYTQADIDNIYRARQSNIQNYQSAHQAEIDDYLAYQNAAFGQDLASRQQQLDADLGYGRESFQQDLAGRQQALDAQLGYGSEAYRQDYMTRQQQLDANRLYSEQAFNQDLQARQQAVSNYLNYGSEEYRQMSENDQRALDAALAEEQLRQSLYNTVNPNETIATTTAAFGG